MTQSNTDFHYHKFHSQPRILNDNVFIGIYSWLIYILCTLNIIVLVSSITLFYTNKWIKFLEDDDLNVSVSAIIVTILSCLLSPCKRTGNIKVQKAFIMIITGTIFLQLLSLNIQWQETHNLFHFTNNTKLITIKNDIIDLYQMGNCSLSHDKISCFSNKWFQNFVNHDCKLSNSSLYDNTTHTCITQHHQLGFTSSLNPKLAIYCQCQKKIIKQLLFLTIPIGIIGIISIMIDIVVLIFSVYIYNQLKNHDFSINDDNV